MKYLLLLSLSFLINRYYSQCSNTAMDLNTWTAQGGTWNVTGTSVNQTVNGSAFYFLSPQPFINVSMAGTLRTDDTDDDIMGFVFGVEGTIGTAPFHYYRFQWDQGGDGNGMYVREYDQTGLLSTLYASVGNYWTRSFNHNFSLTYQTSKIIISVDGAQIMDVNGCFNPGKFGFLNESQANVTYSNFTYTPMPDFLFTTNDSVCLGQPINPNILCSSTGINPYQGIVWDFGDGSTTTNVTSTQHTYTSSGTYDLQLTVVDYLGCVSSITKQVHVFDPSFSLGTDKSICPSTTTTFSPDNTNTGDSYSWNSGESTASITKGVAGSYILTITDVNSCTAKDTVNLSLEAIPTVTFQSNNECQYDSLSFINNTNSSVSELWYFGDGDNTSNFNPKHKYASEGNYTVKLVTTFGQGCSDSTEQTVTVYEVPNASFTSPDDCFNKATVFTNESSISTGSLTHSLWSFGDGQTSNSLNESHTYASDGNYSAKLVVTSDHNCKDTIINTVIRYPLPIPSYTATPECIYNEVSFVDQSTINTPDNIFNWSWNFGPGLNSNLQNPNVLLQTTGTNPVKLIVTSNHGCIDSISSTIEAYTSPNANFITADDCNNLVATFINSSTVLNDQIISYQWNLGDGFTTTSQNISHQYSNPGTYVAQLIVESSHNCRDTIEQNITRYPIPLASFSATNECLYDSLVFTNSSTIDNPNTITDYIWSFGDGSSLDLNENTKHKYSMDGLYQVKLTVISDNNCSDDTIVFVSAYPIPNVNFASVDKCINEGASSFTNTSIIATGGFSSWQWDLGDTYTSNSLAPTHQYITDGTYLVKLIGTSDFGCSDTLEKNITIYNKPTAAFTVDKTEDCVPLCVTFTDNSTDAVAINTRHWTFEENGISILENPEKCFDEDGGFDISLIVTNTHNCKDTLVKDSYINAWPNPVASFTLSKEETDVLHPIINITNFSTDALSWMWNLGNGTLDSTNFDITEVYDEATIYDINLFVRNQYGCLDSINQTLTVNSKPFYYIPNSFTPNGDGFNDVFKVESEGFNFVNMIIFDRWGQKVYSTSDITKGWDGTNKGIEVKQGAYVWLIKYKDEEGSEQIEKGSVIVIK